MLPRNYAKGSIELYNGEQLIETAGYAGTYEDGRRTWRLDKSGSGYPRNLLVRYVLDNGDRVCGHYLTRRYATTRRSLRPAKGAVVPSRSETQLSPCDT